MNISLEKESAFGKPLLLIVPHSLALGGDKDLLNKAYFEHLKVSCFGFN